MKIKSTKNVSNEFKEFMCALQDWINGGCPEGKPFSNHDSVCFQYQHLAENSHAHCLVDNDLLETLPGRVHTASTPFNDGENSPGFGEESRNGTHYKNRKRLAWIKAIVESFEDKA